MKNITAILVFVLSFVVLAIPAMAVDPQTVELEKKRLQQIRNNPRISPDMWRKTGDALSELERDPDLYFYKKQGRQQSAAPTAGSNMAQCMNDCSNEHGICNGDCRGNGSCFSRCSSALARCNSRCR